MRPHLRGGRHAARGQRLDRRLSSWRRAATTASPRSPPCRTATGPIAYTDSGWGNEDVGITLTIMGPDGDVVNAYRAREHRPSDPECNESDPDITVLDNGFIVVSWTNPEIGVDGDIYCPHLRPGRRPGHGGRLRRRDPLDGSATTTSCRRFPAFSPVSSWPPGRTARPTAAATRSPRRCKELVRTTTATARPRR